MEETVAVTVEINYYKPGDKVILVPDETGKMGIVSVDILLKVGIDPQIQYHILTQDVDGELFMAAYKTFVDGKQDWVNDEHEIQFINDIIIQMPPDDYEVTEVTIPSADFH